MHNFPPNSSFLEMYVRAGTSSRREGFGCVRRAGDTTVVLVVEDVTSQSSQSITTQSALYHNSMQGDPYPCFNILASLHFQFSFTSISLVFDVEYVRRQST